jgi:C-terminal processing protease CtpA/Prc
MSEMETASETDKTGEQREPTALALRREALLPNERNRGLGTVAVVCTMAGVASGLALATTLMAMQVADSMSMRAQTCQVRQIEIIPTVTDRDPHGFLGITFANSREGVEISKVIVNSPAEMVGFLTGDKVVAMDGRAVDADTLQETIFNSRPGSHPTFAVERDHKRVLLRPTLVAWPRITY